MNRVQAVSEVDRELDYATKTYGKFASPHEGLAIIEEEVDELRREVYKHHTLRNAEQMVKEAKQISAMAMRFMIDLC